MKPAPARKVSMRSGSRDEAFTQFVAQARPGHLTAQPLHIPDRDIAVADGERHVPVRRPALGCPGKATDDVLEAVRSRCLPLADVGKFRCVAPERIGP